MNLVLIEPKELPGGADEVVVAGRRGRHILGVLRKAPGDRVRVGVVGQGVGEAQVLRVHEDTVTLRLGALGPPPGPSPLVLAIALPRPPMLRRVLQAAACLGLKELHLFHSARVERSFWTSRAVQPQELRAHLLLGLEQARDTTLPSVTVHRRFRPFVEDALPGIVGAKPGLLADADGAHPCPANVPGRAVVVVGPEGGFVPFERSLLCGVGLTPVALGRRPLRVDVAVPALLGRLVALS